MQNVLKSLPKKRNDVGLSYKKKKNNNKLNKVIQLFEYLKKMSQKEWREFVQRSNLELIHQILKICERPKATLQSASKICFTVLQRATNYQLPT